MKKNIGLLIDTMNNGGAQRVVSRLSKILQEEYNVYVILFEDTYNSYQCSCQVINMNLKAKKNGILGRMIQFSKRRNKLENIKKQYKLDVVISFLDSPNFVNILSKNKKCKTIISVRNYSKLENNYTLIGKITNMGIKFLYNKADRIVPVSKVIANNLIEQYGINKDKIFTIYNPYDIENIQSLSSETIESKYDQFMSSGNIIISVGRHMHQKGFWHLLKVFKIVNDVHLETKLVIIGRDEQGGQVEKLVNQLGLSEKVLLLGYHKNPFKFIKRSSVYVLSSLFEGFPNAMVEAMACGCPVVATDCKSGPREILCKNPKLNEVCQTVEKSDYGILIPPLSQEENWDPNLIDYNEKVLAEVLIKFLNDEKQQKDYGDKALKRAKDFNYDRCRIAFKKIIDE